MATDQTAKSEAADHDGEIIAAIAAALMLWGEDRGWRIVRIRESWPKPSPWRWDS